MNVSAAPFPGLLNGSGNGTTSVVSVFQTANSLTDSWLGLAVLLIVWFVFFVIINDAPIRRASVASAFALLSSVFLYVLGLCPSWAVIFCTILVLACFYLLYRESS